MVKEHFQLATFKPLKMAPGAVRLSMLKVQLNHSTLVNFGLSVSIYQLKLDLIKPTLLAAVNKVCPASYFNDNAQDASRCLKCFCFDLTTECHSSFMTMISVN